MDQFSSISLFFLSFFLLPSLSFFSTFFSSSFLSTKLPLFLHSQTWPLMYYLSYSLQELCEINMIIPILRYGNRIRVIGNLPIQRGRLLTELSSNIAVCAQNILAIFLWNSLLASLWTTKEKQSVLVTLRKDDFQSDHPNSCLFPSKPRSSHKSVLNWSQFINNQYCGWIIPCGS